MSTSAHERRCYLANWSARDIANSLFQKWAVKGFFPESPCRMLSLVLSFAPKESTIPRRGGSPITRAAVGASFPTKGDLLTAKLSPIVASRGLSSGQTIDAARTAVRSACCLPELRVANRLRRLCPLGDGELFKFNLKSSVCQRQTGLPKGNPPCVFPTFPPVPFGP